MVSFNIGDRVRCVRSYQDGVYPGECGMVVAVKQDYLYVRWDSFLETRHNCGGRCERGYGWNLPSSHVVFAEPEVDFGDLPTLDINLIL